MRCARCATLYVLELGDHGALLAYDRYYSEGNARVPAFVHRRLDEIVATFTRYRATNRLLDIGCGAGALLRAAARAGWAPEGIELSSAAVAHLRAEGFKIVHGELVEAGYSSGHFDVVTAIEVLEHVPDPRALLAEVARILRPGGLLMGTTPHGQGLSARFLGVAWSVVAPAEHLQLFSRTGIAASLDSVGFRRVRLATHGLNPLELWHRINPGRRDGGFDRPASSYRFNEKMSRSAFGRTMKTGLNAILNMSRLGDSIKFRAER